MIKALPWILFGLTFAVTMYLFILLVDAGLIVDDSRSQGKYLRERSELALSIVRNDWIGKDAASVAQLSKELEKQGVIVGVEEGVIKIGDFNFKIVNGIVTEVQYIN